MDGLIFLIKNNYKSTRKRQKKSNRTLSKGDDSSWKYKWVIQKTYRKAHDLVHKM